MNPDRQNDGVTAGAGYDHPQKLSPDQLPKELQATQESVVPPVVPPLPESRSSAPIRDWDLRSPLGEQLRTSASEVKAPVTKTYEELGREKLRNIGGFFKSLANKAEGFLSRTVGVSSVKYETVKEEIAKTTQEALTAHAEVWNKAGDTVLASRNNLLAKKETLITSYQEKVQAKKQSQLDAQILRDLQSSLGEAKTELMSARLGDGVAKKYSEVRALAIQALDEKDFDKHRELTNELEYLDIQRDHLRKEILDKALQNFSARIDELNRFQQKMGQPVRSMKELFPSLSLIVPQVSDPVAQA